jgi:hypothetical protein
MYVPVEKHITHYIVKEKHITRYIVKEKHVTHYIVKEKHVTHYIVKDTVIDGQIDTISLIPSVAVKTVKLTTLLQWLDGFSALDPVRDLLTSKPRIKSKRNDDIIASPTDRTSPFPHRPFLQ